MEVDRAVAEPHPAVGLAPGEGVLEPIPVVALRVILAGVRAAGSRCGGGPNSAPPPPARRQDY